MAETEPNLPIGRARATRDRLDAAAAALFVEHGYEDTTMADIAARAGTSRRTAFNHFPSKGDIAMSWTRQMADRALEVTSETTGQGALARIRAYFQQISRLVEAEPELSRQMMLGWTTAAGPIRYESQLLADLTPLLEEGHAHDEVDHDVHVEVAARALSDVYMGAVFRWVREPGAGDGLREVADTAIELVLSAVASRRRDRPVT